MDDYERLDLHLHLLLDLIDEEYEEIPGFTTPDRVIAVGLRYRR